jgi:hypothetical protein
LVSETEGGTKAKIFGDRMLRKIEMFWFEVDEVRGGWRRLRVEELHYMHSSQNVIRVIKSRAMRWAGHWYVWGREEVRTVFWLGSLQQRDHLENVSIHWNMTWNAKK